MQVMDTSYWHSYILLQALKKHLSLIGLLLKSEQDVSRPLRCLQAVQEALRAFKSMCDLLMLFTWQYKLNALLLMLQT